MTARNFAREARIVALYRDGWTLRQIGADYEISYERVRKVLEQAGQARRHDGASRRFDAAEAARLYLSGLSCAQVGVRLGVSGCSVRYALVGAGIPRRPRGKKPKKARTA